MGAMLPRSCGEGRRRCDGGEPSRFARFKPKSRNSGIVVVLDYLFVETHSGLRFEVLVQAKEVLGVVLLLDSHEPVVVESKRGFNRVFSLLTQVIQVVRTASETVLRKQLALLVPTV